MSKGKPRISRAAAEARKAVLDALQAGQSLTESEAGALVERLEREYRQAGWSAGYDDGQFDATYDD
jgi:hypothetical protein